MDRASEYAEDVKAGVVVAGPYVRAICERFLRELRQPPEGFYWDPEAAAVGIGWFEKVLNLGAGPFTLYDWQAFCVGTIHGWKRDDGTRRFRRAYWETGKGSGKTPLAAGMALGLAIADGEHRAEGYICARTMDQALVTFRDMAALVEDTPELQRRCRVLGGEAPYNIVYKKSNSFVKRLAAQDRGEGRSGYRPHVIIIDEYHEHANSAMLDMMWAGVKARKQPLLLVTTNAGVSLTSACGIEHEYACKVALGTLEDNAYFPYVCALDEGDDPEDEATWPKANPSLPGIPGHEYIRSQLDMALGMPSKRSIVDRLNFCKWVDAESPWIDADVWFKAETPVIDQTGPCWAALDLSARTDLTAGAVVWRPDDVMLHLETTIWTPGETMRRRAEIDAAPYPDWAKEGHIIPTPGSAMDFEQVALWLIQLATDHDLQGLAYDPWRMSELKRELGHHGVTHNDDGLWIAGKYIPTLGHPQGFMNKGKDGLGMPISIDTTERKLHQGALVVKANPALRSAALGAVAVSDESRNRRFVKMKSKTRIDPMVAAAMAVGYSTMHDPTDWDLDAFKVLSI